MINTHDQTVIIAYLAEKLGVDENWFVTKQDFLFDATPQQVVADGYGDHLIEWLEGRLGLRPAQAF